MPPSIEVTCTLLLFIPAVVPVTFTETVHDALTASVPPARLTEADPDTAVAVPPQVLLRLLGVATVSPAGRLSVKTSPVSAKPEFGLVMLKVSEVLPFSGIVAAPNVLTMDGGLATVRVADVVLPVPPLVEVTAPVVFVYEPEAVPCTLTTTVQEVFTAILPPVRLMLVDPATAVWTPPQLLIRLLGVATTNPAGRRVCKGCAHLRPPCWPPDW